MPSCPGAGGACSYVRQGGPGIVCLALACRFQSDVSAIPSFGPHRGRALPCAVPSFRPLASAGPAAIRTAHPGGQRGCCTGVCRWAHQPRRRQTTTPQTATLPVVEVTEGSATPNGKLTRHTRGNRQPPGPGTARETPASVTVVENRATIEARAPRTPGNLAGCCARRDTRTMRRAAWA